MKKRKKLSLEERQRVQVLIDKGLSRRQIAKVMNRSPSSIIEELNRNQHPFPEVHEEMSPLERAADCHLRTIKRRQLGQHSRQWKLSARDKVAWEYVMSRIKEHTSPEKIAKEVGTLFVSAKISRCTIYNHLKRYRPELIELLPLGGKERKQRVSRKRNQFQEAAAFKRSIWVRPLGAFDHSEFGHWEGDTIHSGKDGSGAILSLRELKSRERIYIPLKDLKADTTRFALEAFFELIPAHLKLSLTVDRGSEFAEHREFEESGKGMLVYFCDAYCSWQKGSVENSNREFRKHFPKGTDFSKILSEAILCVQNLLNRELMECLGWVNSEDTFSEARKLAA